MLAPLGFALAADAVDARRTGAAWAWAGAGVVMVAAAALSYSRAGFALTLGSVAASTPLLLKGRLGRRRWLIPALIAAAAALLVGVYAWDGLARRLAQDPLDDLRWQYLRYAPQAVRAYLPWGSGLGSFRWVYAVVEPLPAMTSSYAGHAHNDLLQIAVEAGIPGLVLVATFLCLVAWWSVRNLPMGAARGHDKNVTTGVIAVVAWAPLLHSLVDYPLRTLAVAALLGFLPAWTAAPRDSTPRNTGAPS
jgi:O-antigen ligase